MKKKNLIGIAFASPWMIGFLVFSAYPIVMSLYYSFTKFNILQSPQWIGLTNYQHMIHDPLFWRSLFNTFYITIFGVPLSIVLGIGAAVLLNQKVRGVGIFRTLMFLPTIVPPVAVAIVWMFILNPDYGLLNALLSFFHLPQPGWLADPGYSKASLLLMVLWQSGQIIVIMLAGLQDVPKSIYEAAEIDGASEWMKFRRITLPMLSPVIFFNVVIGAINFLQFFTQAFVVAPKALGSPAHSTLFYTTYIYQNAFQYMNMGYASAMAWGLLILTLVLTFVIFKIGKRSVFYGGD
ncbi:carbohydrate ABC transporter permease [Sporolactobacillus terrae]|uniref:carbohydrate ABC transporter permease n=1 Tax=Sporolactobacillus terrae TaxID=269673 RepID=UPI000AC94F03|nr:sugar ABC transporter permease [Sporolactobacillus terrae]